MVHRNVEQYRLYGLAERSHGRMSANVQAGTFPVPLWFSNGDGMNKLWATLVVNRAAVAAEIVFLEGYGLAANYSGKVAISGQVELARSVDQPGGLMVGAFVLHLEEKSREYHVLANVSAFGDDVRELSGIIQPARPELQLTHLGK